jgi:rhodanese-related sulfurtransferase
MPSPTTISLQKLSRLVGTPRCPAIIDVRTDDDFAADPRLIPAAIRRPFESVAAWAPESAGRPAIVVCEKGLNSARASQHGFAMPAQHRRARRVPGWADAGLPLVLRPAAAGCRGGAPVTGRAPKSDRLSWLIRPSSIRGGHPVCGSSEVSAADRWRGALRHRRRVLEHAA